MTSTLKISTPKWGLDFLKPARYKAAYGGRGSGKSHFFAEMVIESHILDPNRRTVCVREIQKSLNQSVKRLLESKIEDMNAGQYFDVQESRIKNKFGDGVIIFNGLQSHTADSIKSLEGFDVCWCEEAQSLSQRSLDILRPTIRKPLSELWFTYNPHLPTDPIDLLLRSETPPPDSVIKRVNYDDNPWLPDTLRDEMEYDKARDFERYLHTWHGEYQSSSESRVFKNWRIEEFTAPPDASHNFGADWGFANDPTTLIRCHIIGRKLYVDYEAWQVGCEIVDTPALFQTVPDSERYPIIGDSSRPETISHLKKHGYPKIYPAVKGPGSVQDGVEWLKSFDIIVHPRCVYLVDELKKYSYKIDSLTNKVLPVLADKDNHLIDALRYACEGARRAANTKKINNFVHMPTSSVWTPHR